MTGFRRKSRRDDVHRDACGGVQNKSERIYRKRRGKISANKDSGRAKAPEDVPGVERRDRNEITPARPNGLAQSAKIESAISGGGSGPARKRTEVYQ